MGRIRVIVIDDSAFMRKVITDILQSHDRMEVICTAKNGREGLEKIRLYSPDVVTLDIHMPVMDGINTLEWIMKNKPLPVIMLSGLTEEGKVKTVEAMSKGAVDFIQKPSGPISLNLESIRREIIHKVIAASTVRLNKESYMKEKAALSIYDGKKCVQYQTIVVVGASTGGPRALHRIISDLPDNFSSPIFIVQHMPEGFTKSLAERLNSINDLHVKEAEDGEIVKNYTIYVAPGNNHMRVKRKKQHLYISLSNEQPRNGHRPSVDILFESVSNLLGYKKIAVVLTGMGNDGSEGINTLKHCDNGTTVIAESQETAIVNGMPKAAIHTTYVDYIFPIYQIGKKLGHLLKRN
ncbi:protein-glutamate methylesterase/protein-glutamine glutaminase [Oceanobacillus halophilus]|uniref:Protein-glutamate methylesterase/protein-glutamine glutaminase n=1 Tax=Oceanobacillus halophilus TaxID=930130 RepID=A0A495ACF8_9BACI|nr:chemotaxis response regulator protein-glutamate methylesterase [Oceanobacillus halophilus]RKQ37503.1 chemotaxis response regulator protein-glutamate methylesterase [Oceanobacillus halophilus]